MNEWEEIKKIKILTEALKHLERLDKLRNYEKRVELLDSLEALILMLIDRLGVASTYESDK